MSTMSILDRAIQGKPLDDVLIIDCHGHVGPWINYYIPGLREEDTLKVMDSVGINKAILFSNAGINSDHIIGNKFVLDYSKPNPDRMVPFVCVNPRYPEEALKEVKHYCGDLGWKGIKIHPSMNTYPATGPNYKPIWEYASDNGIPVISHTWDSQNCAAEIMGKVAEQYPDVTIICAHAIKPDWTGAARLAQKHKNLYLELTDASPHNGLIEWFVKEIGADKLLYGSDLGGWFSPLHGIGPVLYADISDEDKRKILGENAAKNILKL